VGIGPMMHADGVHMDATRRIRLNDQKRYSRQNNKRLCSSITVATCLSVPVAKRRLPAMYVGTHAMETNAMHMPTASAQLGYE